MSYRFVDSFRASTLRGTRGKANLFLRMAFLQKVNFNIKTEKINVNAHYSILFSAYRPTYVMTCAFVVLKRHQI